MRILAKNKDMRCGGGSGLTQKIANLPSMCFSGSNPDHAAIAGLAEWTKAAVLKTDGLNSSKGSNPLSSAMWILSSVGRA